MWSVVPSTIAADAGAAPELRGLHQSLGPRTRADERHDAARRAARCCVREVVGARSIARSDAARAELPAGRRPRRIYRTARRP